MNQSKGRRETRALAPPGSPRHPPGPREYHHFVLRLEALHLSGHRFLVVRPRAQLRDPLLQGSERVQPHGQSSVTPRRLPAARPDAAPRRPFTGRGGEFGGAEVGGVAYGFGLRRRNRSVPESGLPIARAPSGERPIRVAEVRRRAKSTGTELGTTPRPPGCDAQTTGSMDEEVVPRGLDLCYEDQRPAGDPQSISSRPRRRRGDWAGLSASARGSGERSALGSSRIGAGVPENPPQEALASLTRRALPVPRILVTAAMSPTGRRAFAREGIHRARLGGTHPRPRIYDRLASIPQFLVLNTTRAESNTRVCDSGYSSCSILSVRRCSGVCPSGY